MLLPNPSARLCRATAALALALAAAAAVASAPATAQTPRERALELLGPLFDAGEQPRPPNDAADESSAAESQETSRPPPGMTDIPDPLSRSDRSTGEATDSLVDATTPTIPAPLPVPEPGPRTRGANYRLAVAGEPASASIAVREGLDAEAVWLAIDALVAAGGEDGLRVQPEQGLVGGETRHGSHVHLTAAPARLYRSDAAEQPVADLPGSAVLRHDGRLFVTPGLAAATLRRPVEAARADQQVRLGAASPPADTAAGYDPPRAPPEPPAVPAADLQLLAAGPVAASEPTDLPRLTGSVTLEGRAGPWELGGQISGRNRAGTLGGAASPGVHGDTSLDRLSLTAGRDLARRGRGAGVMPRRVEGGDILPVDGPVGSGNALERGVRADSLPRHRYPDLAEVTFRGSASPGSTVLAFQDGRLVEGTRVGLDGRYSLPPAALSAGANTLDVVTVKPTGRHNRQRRRLDTTAARFEPGRPAYQLSLSQAGTPLVPTDSEALAPSLDLPGSPDRAAPEPGGLRSAGTLYMPLSRRWRSSLSAEFADPADRDKLSAGRVGATGVLGPAIADGGVAFGPNERLQGELGLRWGGPGWRLGARQVLADRYRPGGPDSPAEGGTAATSRLTTVFRESGENRVSSLGLSWQRRQADDAVTHRGEAKLGGVADGNHLAAGLGGEWRNAEAPARWAGDGHVAGVLTLPPVTTVALAEMRKVADRDASVNGYGAAHYSVTERLTTSALGRFDQSARVRGEAGLRLSYRVGGVEGGLQASRTSRETNRLTLSLRARLGAPPTQARRRVASEPDLDRGAIDARVNYADRVDPADQPAGSPVAGARVEADGLDRGARTQPNGTALMGALPPDEDIALRVDAGSLALPDRRRARPQRATRSTRIGRAPVVRFTIEDDGRLAGTLRLRTADGTVPAAGLPVTLSGPESGNVIAVAHTGPDGQFRFSGVAAGRYTLGVRDQAARGLGYRPGLREPAELARPGSRQQGIEILMARAQAASGPTGTRNAADRVPAPRSVPAASPASAGGADGSGGPYILYLGDYANTSDRTLAWFGLQQRFGEVLGGTSQLTPDRARATVAAQALPADTQAPLYAGPIEAASRAREICAELTGKQQFCEVRPAPDDGR